MPILTDFQLFGEKNWKFLFRLSWDQVRDYAVGRHCGIFSNLLNLLTKRKRLIIASVCFVCVGVFTHLKIYWQTKQSNRDTASSHLKLFFTACSPFHFLYLHCRSISRHLLVYNKNERRKYFITIYCDNVFVFGQFHTFISSHNFVWNFLWNDLENCLRHLTNFVIILNR